MKFKILCFFLLLLGSLEANSTEKDLNLATLKRAYKWILHTSEEKPSLEDTTIVDLQAKEKVWDAYENLIKKSIQLVKMYPKKIKAKMSELFKRDNRDILPILAFYMYTTEKKDRLLRYYDMFNTIVVPVNQEDLWVAMIPFNDAKNTKINNYSILIIDIPNNRFVAKD